MTRSNTRRSRFTTPTSRVRTIVRVALRQAHRKLPKVVSTRKGASMLKAATLEIQAQLGPAVAKMVEKNPGKLIEIQDQADRNAAKADDMFSRLKAQKEAARALRASLKTQKAA